MTSLIQRIRGLAERAKEDAGKDILIRDLRQGLTMTVTEAANEFYEALSPDTVLRILAVVEAAELYGRFLDQFESEGLPGRKMNLAACAATAEKGLRKALADLKWEVGT